jgi:UDP-N-acetyl-2-amino-2-deoxyglucuronate dehydrogenase
VTVHVGLIGGGNISDTHGRAALSVPGVSVSAVYGDNREKAAAMAHRFHAAAYDTRDAFLAHRPMDLVAIGSPSGLHADQGIRAAARGLHVLVEKPIDITLEKADALISAADAAGVTLGVFFQDRFKPDVSRLKGLLDGLRLGRPLFVVASVPWYRPPEYYSASRWRGTWALDGGGALMNQAIHTLDLLVWLLGDVVDVQATVGTQLHRIEVEDTALALLRFACGAVGVIAATTAAYPGYPRRIHITGTEGSAVLEHDRLARVDVLSPGPDAAVSALDAESASASSPVVADIGPHRAVIEDFLSAIRERRSPRCDGRDARRSVALVRAIYDAASGRRPMEARV